MAPALLISVPDEVTSTSAIDSTLTNPEFTPLCHIITPIGMLGYGFDEAITRDALRDLQSGAVPTALILDSGSTDSGPAKLALGTMTAPRSNYKRDLTKLMRLSDEFHTPILISSAGGDGTDGHVDAFLDIVKEICDEEANRYLQSPTRSLCID